MRGSRDERGWAQMRGEDRGRAEGEGVREGIAERKCCWEISQNLDCFFGFLRRGRTVRRDRQAVRRVEATLIVLRRVFEGLLACASG